MRKTLLPGVLAMAMFAMRSDVCAEDRTIPGWNLSFSVPDGFRSYQSLGQAEFYRKEADGYLLVVTPAVDRSTDEAIQALRPAIPARGMSGSLDGEPRRKEIAGCLIARTQAGSLVLPIQVQGGALVVAGKAFHRQ